MARRLFPWSDEEERERQDRLMLDLEAALQPKLAAAIAREMRALVTGWLNHDFVPPLSEDFTAAIASMLNRNAAAAIDIFATRTIEAARAEQSAKPALEVRFIAEIVRRLAQRYIGQEAYRQRITSISETTRNQVIAAVRAGDAAGLGQEGTAKMIRDAVPTISRHRSGLIARTETHGAANYGHVGAATETGLSMRKKWLAAIDERTRWQHSAINGHIVAAEDHFVVPTIRDDLGYSIRYPGDPNAPAYGTINCRCVLTFIVDD